MKVLIYHVNQTTGEETFEEECEHLCDVLDAESEEYHEAFIALISEGSVLIGGGASPLSRLVSG
jgi:hypothetical protein